MSAMARAAPFEGNRARRWYWMSHDAQLVDRQSSSEAKIVLFRSLLRGREDVYPRRFESRKTSKAG